MKRVLLNQCSHLPQVISLILAATLAGCIDTAAPDPVLEFLEIRPGAQVEGADLLASVWLLNRWPDTVRLETPSSCLTQQGYPALFSTSGEQVAYSSWGCWGVLTTHTIAPGDSLFRQWELGITSVGSGVFTLRFRFAVYEINGRPATLPGTRMTVVIGG